MRTRRGQGGAAPGGGGTRIAAHPGRDPVLGLGAWVEALDRIRARTPRWKVRVFLAALLALLCLLDYATGPLTTSLLYGLVVLTAAQVEGESGLIWVVPVAAFLDLGAEAAAGQPATATDVANEAFRAVLWLLLGSIGVLLRDRTHLAEERRRELQKAYRQIEADLEAAELVQQAFMDRPLPRHPALGLEVRRLVARRLGGDFFDLSLEGDLLWILVADVSGKGSPAALVTGLLRGALADIRRRVSAPADVLHLLNRTIAAHVPEGMFVTCFYACLDLRLGELVYGNAGHEPALLRRADHTEELLPTGIPLGIEPGESFEQRRLTLDPGDLLLVYTDGLADSRPPGGPRLEVAGIQEIQRLPLDARTLASRLEWEVREREGEQPRDDVIILAASWRE